MNNVAAEMEHLHKLAKGNPSKRFTRLWGLISRPRKSRASNVGKTTAERLQACSELEYKP